MTDVSRSNLTPTETKVVNTTLGAVRTFKNSGIEKALVYVIGAVGATNGFTFLHLSGSLREVLVGASAFIVGMIHNSSSKG